MKNFRRDPRLGLILTIIAIVLLLGSTLYFSIIVWWESVNSEFQSYPITAFCTVTGWFGTLVALVGGFYGWHYYRNRPKIIIGLISADGASEYFDKISYDEVHFKRSKLAPMFDANICPPDLDKKLEKCKVHKISPNAEGAARLFIVLQNVGRRKAVDYSVTITIDKGIDIVNFESEQLNLDGLYTSHPSLIKDSELREYLPGASILEFYGGVLFPQLKLEQAYIRFTDSLEAFGFETICLTVQPQEGIKEFCIYYRCDCPDVFPVRQLYAQRIRLDNPKATVIYAVNT